MKSLLRWVLRGLGLVVTVALAGFALGWYLVGRSLPDYDATLVFDGIEGELRVIRDANAVPHIRATSDHDAFFAMGLVHAQDRLWQMEINRRSAHGRLAAYFGEGAVGIDRLSKTLDLGGYARRALEHQTPEATAALEAYAKGVNAWIRHVNQEAMGRGAPEFFLFAEEGLAPWTPQDSLAILKLMALRLSGAARHEIRRGRFLLDLKPERVVDILPDYPRDASSAPPRFSALFPGARFARSEDLAPAPDERSLMAVLGPAHRPEFAGASNAWAVDGTRSSSGAPLLASDPHLWLSAPTIWYLLDVQGPGLAAIGGTMPGVPAVLIGRNREIGWGLTTASVDDQDIFIHRLNPENPGQYRGPNGWLDFETRQVRIPVSGQAPAVETIRTTRHGPVLARNMFGVDAVTPAGHVAALSWTALQDRDRSLSAAIAMMRAGDVDEAVEAAGMVLAPAQNVVIADRTQVAMVTAGALPIRQRNSPSRGRIPSPGWVTRNDWEGIRPFAENPQVIDPRTGAVANANNRITDAFYPNHLSFDWDAPYRISRLEKELSGRAFHSRDSFVALQTDSVSEMARSILPLVARDLWWDSGASGAGRSELREQALDLLAAWTGEMDQHAPEPLIFAEWLRQLTRRLAADELGPLFSEIEGLRPLFVERVYRDIDGASIWCDVDKTPRKETCSEMSVAALDDALTRLSRDYGSNIEAWRWGAAHVAEHLHVPLGLDSFGPAGLLVSIIQETSGGDFTLLRGLTPGRGDTPFRNVHAAGLRVVYDFADLDRSVMIIATGQSGHPFSRWYDHLAGLWARGDVIPMSMNDDDARTGAIGTLTVRPSGRGE